MIEIDLQSRLLPERALQDRPPPVPSRRPTKCKMNHNQTSRGDVLPATHTIFKARLEESEALDEEMRDFSNEIIENKAVKDSSVSKIRSRL